MTLAGLLLVGIQISGLLPVGPGAARPVLAQEQPVVIEAIEIRGNSRTPRSTIERYLSLRAGDRVAPDSLVAAVEELRASLLFRSVDFSSRRGSERGHVILDLEVTERKIEFRLGAGYQDFGGWYLIPAELRMDNRFGTGEQLRLKFQIGYRTVGLYLDMEQPRFGDGRNQWGLGLFNESLERVYFLDGVPYTHNVERHGIETHVGRQVTKALHLEAGAGVEGVVVDSSATSQSTNRLRDINFGQELPFADLPAGVAAAVGSRTRGRLRADATWDTRSARRVASTPAAGAWGRLRLEQIVGSGESFPILTADLRGYRSLGPLALAARGNAGLLGHAAPFHDRFYVGGQNSVRGFPEESRTDPGGDTRFWSSSLELRGAMIGPPDTPRLAGLLFLDAAESWDTNAPRLDEISVGAGWGVRWRVGWLGWFGLDVCIPLTPSPVNEAFRVHGSLGLSF